MSPETALSLPGRLGVPERVLAGAVGGRVRCDLDQSQTETMIPKATKSSRSIEASASAVTGPWCSTNGPAGAARETRCCGAIATEACSHLGKTRWQRLLAATLSYTRAREARCARCREIGGAAPQLGHMSFAKSRRACSCNADSRRSIPEDECVGDAAFPPEPPCRGRGFDSRRLHSAGKRRTPALRSSDGRARRRRGRDFRVVELLGRDGAAC